MLRLLESLENRVIQASIALEEEAEAMIAREELHRLVDELAEDELVAAKSLLESLRDRIQGQSQEFQVSLGKKRHTLLSPRLANPDDAALFSMKMTILDEPPMELGDAGTS